MTGHWRMDATHTGPLVFLGLPPTGKVVTMAGIEIMRFVDGRIAEVWHLDDVAGLLQQLGTTLPATAGG